MPVCQVKSEMNMCLFVCGKISKLKGLLFKHGILYTLLFRDRHRLLASLPSGEMQSFSFHLLLFRLRLVVPRPMRGTHNLSFLQVNEQHVIRQAKICQNSS